MRRALILGGGGVIGVAWETGIVAGLLEGGVDLREADLVIGTSAGSLVGARIAAGQDLGAAASEAAASSTAVDVPIHADGLDVQALGRVFATWSKAARMSEEVCKEIGSLAGAAHTAPEQVWIESTGGSLGIDDWPDVALRITTVDIETGQFEVHSKQSGAPLQRAVAASCAVPGMFPPVSIGGRRYMDGGVRSGTSADAALDVQPDVALVIAPICAATAPIGLVAERAMNDEVAELRAAGAKVAPVIPLDAEIEAFGPDLMDPARAEGAMRAGHARGVALAAAEAGIWHP